jgi:hypothetical protein
VVQPGGRRTSDAFARMKSRLGPSQVTRR